MADQQPDKVIDVPGVGSVAFPNSMTDAQINAAATKLYKGANPTKKQPPVTSWVDTAVDWLPTASAIVGGTLGTAGGPIGAVAGAALGGAGGEAWKQNINRMRGADAPTSATDAALAIGKEGAQDAALAGVGVAGGKIVKSGAPLVGRAAEALGGAVEGAADSGAVRWGSRALAAILGLKGGAMREAIEAYAIPPLMKGGGRVLSAGGRAISGRTAESTATKAVTSGLERSQLAERLAQIPTQIIDDSLTGDVALIRASISKGMNPSTAIRIIADGSADYADTLKRAFAESVKQSGVPPGSLLSRFASRP